MVEPHSQQLMEGKNTRDANTFGSDALKGSATRHIITVSLYLPSTPQAKTPNNDVQSHYEGLSHCERLHLDEPRATTLLLVQQPVLY